MPRLLRIVFTWLLLLALPLQGQATAAMLNCGPAASISAAAPMADEHASHSAHHATHRAALQQAHPAAHDHHAPASDTAQATPDHPGCSACAACCVGLALTPQAPRIADAPAAEAHVLPPPAGHPSFVTGGPERPPRAVLA